MPSNAAHDDLSVLRAYAKRRDASAFEQLVLRYQAMVFATCRRELAHDSDAEDAAQETFLKLSRKASSIRTRPAAWLHACAVGTARDLIRRRQVRRRHETAAGAVRPESEDTTWSDLEPEIDAALEKLNDRDRDLIVQRFLMGRAQTELAEQAGVTPSAIHQRVQRAVERLRDQLRNRGIVVATGALGVALTQVPANAAVPTALGASLMKIGISGVGEAAGTSTLTSVTQFVADASIKTKLAMTGATALVAGGAITVAAVTSSPTPQAGANHAAVTAALSNDPVTLSRAWGNAGWLVDGEPGIGARFEGNQMQFRVPGSRPDELIQMRLELLETDPNASPPRFVFRLLETNLPGAPIGQASVGSYELIGDRLALAVNSDPNGPRPSDLGLVSGELEASALRQMAPKQSDIEVEVMNLGWVIMADRLPDADGERLAMAVGLDPRLAGVWAGRLPGGMEIRGDLIMSPNPFASSLEVVRWEPDRTPARFESVIIESVDQNFVGQIVRAIYEVRDGRMRVATYQPHSAKAGQWPTGFTGQRGDFLETTTWVPVAPDDLGFFGRHVDVELND